MFTAPQASSSAAVSIWASFLASVLLGPVVLVPTFCNCCGSWCWNNVSKRLCLTSVIWWLSYSYGSIAFSQSASDHVVAHRRALFRNTWNFLRCDVVTFSAPHTRTCIAARISWIFCFRNCSDSVANCSFTSAVADFNIFRSRKAPVFFWYCFSASSSAVRDRSGWFCWLTSRENSHNARTAPITISSEAVSAGVYLSFLEQSKIGVHFTASVLNMPQISLPYQELLFIESNCLEMYWRPGYYGTDVNRLSNWSLTFLAFWYLISQFNKSLTKPKINWCNSSGCQSW